MSFLLKEITDALRAAVDDQSLPLPTVLGNIQQTIDKLSQLSTDWGQLNDWLATLKALPDVGDSLLARALQIRYPRLAEALTALGIIQYQFNNDQLQAFHIDWNGFFSLLTAPNVLFSTARWGQKIQSKNDAMLMQVYLALLVIAPKVLLQVEYNQAGLASLPSHDLNDQQKKLLSVVNSPVKLAFPFPTPPISSITDTDDGKQGFVSFVKGNIPANHYLSFDAVAPDPDTTLFPNYFQTEFDVDVNKLPAIFNHALPLADNSAWILTITSLTPSTARFTLGDKDGTWTASVSIPTPSTDMLEISVKRSTDGIHTLQMGDNTAHLEVSNLSLVLKLMNGTSPDGKTPTFSIGGHVNTLSFTMKPPDILPIDEGLHFETDINTDYVQGSGLRAQGNVDGNALPLLGIEFAKAINVQIGSAQVSITIERITVRVQTVHTTSLRARVVLLCSATLKIGPVSVTIADVGAWFGHWLDDSLVGIQPIDGLGISIDAGTVTGGGFLLTDGNSYSGVLNLKVLFVDVFAFGIYKQVHNSPASFVAVMGARFPGIQLGFGFMLTGIGGLIGINRRANTDLLRERLASGASGNVLFCEDPVHNAPTLLGDLAAFFPEAPGVFVIGPTLQISWLYLVRFDLGIFIELPGPSKIFVLGSAKALIGFSENAALLYLRMDVFGEIDFTRKLIAFDAHLINSTALGVLNITGGSAFRLCYGNPAYVLLSIGGFHERFNPGPIAVPHLERAGASLSLNVIAHIWLRLEMYVAFTSNTLQLGAHLEAGLDIGPLSAEGFLSFDALIQFRPFHFDIDFHAGLNIKAFGISWANVNVDGTISGPGPLVIHASASVKRLFIKVSADATFTLGSSNGDKPVPIKSSVQELQPELDNPSNLRAEGEDTSVIYKQGRAAVHGALVSPLGSLIWEQKKAPLKTLIDRLNGVPLEQPQVLQLVEPPTGQYINDMFCPGAFTKRSESEALNSSTFESLPSGMRISESALEDAPGALSFSVTIDMHKITHDELRTSFLSFSAHPYMTAALASSLHERSSVPMINAGLPVVKATEEKWNVYNTSGNVLIQDQAPFQAFQIARNQPGHIALTAYEEVVKL